MMSGSDSTSVNTTMSAQTMPAPTPPDWGRGRYERTAAQLLPAAQAVVDAAGVGPGERVLDIGCGTGNAALIAARLGARVTGVDPAERLLDVARGLAREEGLDVGFRSGDAASLPVPDDSFDAVLSNFAVIFASDADAAVAEMVRVLAPAGRIVFSSWLRHGAVGQLSAVAPDLIRRALDAPPPPRPFAWHDENALRTLFAAHDMTVTVAQHDLVFTDESPEAYLEAERHSHPLAVAGFEVLERLGQAEQAHKQLLQILTDGNEDTGAFRSTSHYLTVTAVGR